LLSFYQKSLSPKFDHCQKQLFDWFERQKWVCKATLVERSKEVERLLIDEEE